MIHPFVGQGFNMTIRDVKILLEIIVSKLSLGLNIDSSVNYDFENKLKQLFEKNLSKLYKI